MAKRWGNREFWGIGNEFDPDWLLDRDQLELRDKLIEMCQQKIRPMAIRSDKTYEYPTESLDVLCQLGLLGLIVPKELGGLGQSHCCAVMIVETLARYGCPSTAMIYAMHIQTMAILLFRHHDNDEIKKLLSRVTCDRLIGTSSYSDAATGGHFWFPLSAKSQKIDDEKFKLFRFNSWTTSAGFADIYVFQTPTPGVERDHSHLTGFFALKDDVRASTDDWSALGLHGNQSGPMIVEGIFDKTRMVGNLGDGRKSNDEVGAIMFLLSTSACWNGIAMGCIDVTKKHVCSKTHGDLGTRVCDYPIIQDYVGEAVITTNNARIFLYTIAQQLDAVTENNNWSLHTDPDFTPRSAYVLWLMQVKHSCSENVSLVSDKMLKACGGDGFKTQTGIERLLRDSKAGCLMAPTNEVVRNLIGLGSLKGLQALDMWDQSVNVHKVQHEIEKMNLSEKKSLLQRLSLDVELEEKSVSVNHPFQDCDFDNPFNTSSPAIKQAFVDDLKIEHKAAVSPDSWTKLILASRDDFTTTVSSFVFNLPNHLDHLGCLAGQYVQIRVTSDDRCHERFLSPVTSPNSYGTLELVVKLETHGIFSNIFRNLRVGDSAEFRGPCGGFEYSASELEEVTILASGPGLTPGIQILRTIATNPEDTTRLTLLYYSEDHDNILFRDELQRTALEDERIRVVMTLGECPIQWKGEEGYINHDLIDKYITKPNGTKRKIIICGGPSMSISCLHALRILDYPSEMIYIYGQFGTEQIRSVYGKRAKLSSHTSSFLNN